MKMTTTAILILATLFGTTCQAVQVQVALGAIWSNGPPRYDPGWRPVQCTGEGATTPYAGLTVLEYAGPGPCERSGCPSPVQAGATLWCYAKHTERSCNENHVHYGEESTAPPGPPLSSTFPGGGTGQNGCMVDLPVVTQRVYNGWAANIDGTWRTTSSAEPNCTSLLANMVWPKDWVNQTLKGLQASTPFTVRRVDPALELLVADWDSMAEPGLASSSAMFFWPNLESIFPIVHTCLSLSEQPPGPEAGQNVRIRGPCRARWDPNQWNNVVNAATAVDGNRGQYRWKSTKFGIVKLGLPLQYWLSGTCGTNNTVRNQLESLNTLDANCLALYGGNPRGACASTLVAKRLVMPAPTGPTCGVECGITASLLLWSGIPPHNSSATSTTMTAPTTSWVTAANTTQTATTLTTLTNTTSTSALMTSTTGLPASTTAPLTTATSLAPTATSTAAPTTTSTVAQTTTTSL
jgi:hypothetical protein